MRLYHGSTVQVQKPQFGVGKATNDYGRGFYCTESLDLAKEWACPAKSDGFANSYDIDIEGLRVLDLNAPGRGILEWLSVLITNRPVRLESPVQAEAVEWLKTHFAVSLEGYDIVRGYRADDSYFGFVRSFLENGISLSQLSKAMRLGNLGEQVMIKSERAFARLNFVGAEISPWLTYYVRRQKRDADARSDFRKETAIGTSDGIYMIDILRGKMERNDARLR